MANLSASLEIFKEILSIMIEKKASDLYLTEGVPPGIKVDGALVSIGNKPLTSNDTAILLQSIISEEDWHVFKVKHELNMPLSFPGIGRFRLNAYRQRAATAMVIRAISTQIPTIDELGLPSVLKDLSLNKRGLLLLVGATGSGKSTTLAAMIDHRNRNSKGHIMTIEDPIEFVHEHKGCIISQREIGIDTESLEAALKNSLRQAPDLILIGEIRDKETMEAAIAFAETGHLCVATLHSNNANQAVERMMNFFTPERHRQIYMQLSLNLRGIISQRLIKSIKGGRAAALEILMDSARVKDLIMNGNIHELKEALEKGFNIGMQTFDMALYGLYKNGEITLEDALKNADSPNNLRIKIKLEESNQN